MTIKITVMPCKNYIDGANCGITKGLRRKGIFGVCSPDKWQGLFLGFIPVWGKIPYNTNEIALCSDERGFKPTPAHVTLWG